HVSDDHRHPQLPRLCGEACPFLCIVRGRLLREDGNPTPDARPDDVRELIRWDDYDDAVELRLLEHALDGIEGSFPPGDSSRLPRALGMRCAGRRELEAGEWQCREDGVPGMDADSDGADPHN